MTKKKTARRLKTERRRVQDLLTNERGQTPQALRNQAFQSLHDFTIYVLARLASMFLKSFLSYCLALFLFKAYIDIIQPSINIFRTCQPRLLTTAAARLGTLWYQMPQYPNSTPEPIFRSDFVDFYILIIIGLMLSACLCFMCLCLRN
ncbi:unnamed protein product [Caenorhabditis auriculariae]|uniref:Uncharacterized protein n=1 Tax=Caenorhabditis auriculariae TaxID=2777116 RepID=A0A8S1HXC5_9PELO|nr:unnamed protein product [Caenorhabditis auriculariae]